MKYGLLGLFGGIIIGYFLFSSAPKNQIITNTITDTIYSKYTDTVTITKWKVKNKIIPNDTIYINFDSTKLLEIAKEYYSTNLYDTTITAAQCELSFKASISKNKVKSANFGFKNNRPTLINKQTIYNPKYFVGGGLSTRVEFWAGGGFMSKRMLFTAEYGIFNRQVKASVYYSIFQ